MPYWVLLKRLHFIYENEKTLFLEKVKEKENEISRNFVLKENR